MGFVRVDSKQGDKIAAELTAQRKALMQSAKAREIGAKIDPRMVEIAAEADRLARTFDGSALAKLIAADMNRHERIPLPAVRPAPVQLDPEARANLAEIGKAIKMTATEVTAANERAEAAERRERWWKVAALVLPIVSAVGLKFLLG